MEKIKKINKLIGIAELEKIESMFKIVLPEDYTKHMLKYNGGRPISKNMFFKPDIWGNEVMFTHFLPIKYGTSLFETSNLNEEDFLDYPEKHLYIGRTLTGNLSISFKEAEHGDIYVSYSDGEMHKLADSVTEFLDGLEQTNEFD